MGSQPRAAQSFVYQAQAAPCTRFVFGACIFSRSCETALCPAVSLAMKGEPPGFAPCTLGRGKDGDPATFFAKASGYGYNDMITLPTLTKESILENLKRRFKVGSSRATPLRAGRAPIARPEAVCLAPALRGTARASREPFSQRGL